MARASSSWRSTRSASMVAAWPRRAELTQVLLAGPVPRAVWALMSRCGLAVPRPSGAAGLQPGAEQAGGEVVQGAGPAAQEQAAAARVGVAEEHGADRAAAGRVNAGQGHDEPGGRGGGGGDGVVDVVLAQRLQHGGGGPAADLDAPGGVAEDHAGREAEPEQRAEGYQGVMAL